MRDDRFARSRTMLLRYSMVSKRRDRRRPERGFTLIEMMIVVVIIAILAALVIPSFLSESQRTKGKSEVAAFFGELATRQEQYKVDNGTYRAITQCPASAPAETTVTMDCHLTGNLWQGGTVATNL